MPYTISVACMEEYIWARPVYNAVVGRRHDIKLTSIQGRKYLYNTAKTSNAKAFGVKRAPLLAPRHLGLRLGLEIHESICFLRKMRKTLIGKQYKCCNYFIVVYHDRVGVG